MLTNGASVSKFSFYFGGFICLCVLLCIVWNENRSGVGCSCGGVNRRKHEEQREI